MLEIIERRRIRRSRSRERERERTKRKISHDRDSRENREEEQKKERTEFFNNIKQQRTDAFRDGNLCDKCKDITRECACVCSMRVFARLVDSRARSHENKN